MSALTDAVEAARTVVAERGTPGAMSRRQDLDAALDLIRLSHPELDVVIAAALWSDRYGRAGAGEAMNGLVDAVRALPTEGDQ